jgi:amino acid transporter
LASIMINFTLGATIFLFLLNVAFAVIFRKKRRGEFISYIVVALLEGGVFAFALALRLHLLSAVPYHLPPGLPFNRAELGAAIAIGVGLFPAAYWHRTSTAQLRARLEADAKMLKEQEKSVRVRSSTPGEWMN